MKKNQNKTKTTIKKRDLEDEKREKKRTISSSIVQLLVF